MSAYALSVGPGIELFVPAGGTQEITIEAPHPFVLLDLLILTRLMVAKYSLIMGDLCAVHLHAGVENPRLPPVPAMVNKGDAIRIALTNRSDSPWPEADADYRIHACMPVFARPKHLHS